MTMTHPGLPDAWAILVLLSVALLSLWALYAHAPGKSTARYFSLHKVAWLNAGVALLNRSPWPLVLLKILVVILFLLVICAGLWGTAIAERNLATTLTWNIWWAGLIISVFFLGSAWCAVCPWDTLAQWLVRRRLWRRSASSTSMQLRVPKLLRSVWPALIMFIALTWLELGVGVTTSPYATAVLALVMVVLATVSLSVYKRKAFCHYFCPVGRTIGFYAQLAPVALRASQHEVCTSCKTLECYHGNASIEPCPTHLVMGSLKQNTYCTSCGNCVLSCPHENVSWQLRQPSVEAIQDARPRRDEAWFMLGLLALTGFHGVTMMPFWEDILGVIARRIGDSGQLLGSFSIGLAISFGLPIALYLGLIKVFYWVSDRSRDFWSVFASLSFVALPLAFAYHLAHNLNHLVREGSGLGAVFLNPLGVDTQPLSMAEKHMRHLEMLIPQASLSLLQAVLMMFGFWVAVQVIRHRGWGMLAQQGERAGWRLAPLLLFAAIMTLFHLWLLVQPMVMRM